MNVSFILPLQRSTAPLELWSEIRPIIDEFVYVVAFGRPLPILPEEETVDGDWRELPLLLEGDEE